MKVLTFLLIFFSGIELRADVERAIFAGGCFWCMEKPFEELEGVVSVKSGYVGGTKTNPTYEEVSAGTTGHVEAVEVIYDGTKIDYPALLKVFWKNVNPLDEKGQFCDKGEQYRSGIFTLTEEQEKEARSSLKVLEETTFKGKKIATFIRSANQFWPAEDYHQDYYIRNPIRYKFYRYRCGRDATLKEVWGE